MCRLAISAVEHLLAGTQRGRPSGRPRPRPRGLEKNEDENEDGDEDENENGDENGDENEDDEKEWWTPHLAKDHIASGALPHAPNATTHRRNLRQFLVLAVMQSPAIQRCVPITAATHRTCPAISTRISQR